MNKKRAVAVFAVLVIMSLMAVKLALNKREINEKNQPSTTSGVAVSVTTEIVKKSPAKISFTKPGTLLPLKEVDISSTTQGKLEKINFELGSKVNEGQTVAKVDSRMKELALEQAELSIAKLERDYERFQVLLAGDAATQTNVNDIKFNLENAKNQAEQIRRQISDSHIKAPASGTVVRRNFDEGEFVNFGTPLGTIVDVSKLKVQLNVSEKEVYGISEKQKVTVTSDLTPEILFSGEVNYVSPKGDDTHNYLVEITMKNDSKNSLKAGTFVYVEFSHEAEGNVLQIPRSALVESLRSPYVFVISDNKAEKRKIRAGREFGDNIEVVSGLKEGETIVTSGQINLTEGASVNVISNE